MFSCEKHEKGTCFLRNKIYITWTFPGNFAGQSFCFKIVSYILYPWNQVKGFHTEDDTSKICLHILVHITRVFHNYLSVLDFYFKVLLLKKYSLNISMLVLLDSHMWYAFTECSTNHAPTPSTYCTKLSPQITLLYSCIKVPTPFWVSQTSLRLQIRLSFYFLWVGMKER